MPCWKTAEGLGKEADRMIVLGCCSLYHDFLNLHVSPGKGFQNSKFWMPGDFFSMRVSAADL